MEEDQVRETKLLEYFYEDLAVLQSRGYPAGDFRRLLVQHGAVGTVEYLMAGPVPQSGFSRLWEMGELERSVEFSILLPWFSSLFESQPQVPEEAERRLILFEFPLAERLAIPSANPPGWAQGLG